MLKRRGAMTSSVSSRLFDAVNTVLLLIIMLAMLYPFWHELCLSFSSGVEAEKGGLFLLPRAFTLGAYERILFGASNYLYSSYRNSLICVIAVTSLGVLLTAMLAYGLSKKQVPGHRGLSLLVLVSMVFSGGMIPTFLTMQGYSLLDTLWALILPMLVTPYNVIIMRSFFYELPPAIEEAARIDGATPLRVFFSIILPLSKAVLATVALWLAVASWNNFQSALLYLNSRSKFTLPIYIREVMDGYMIAQATGEGAGESTESVIATSIMVTVAPIVIVYPFLQKYFVKGVTIGSVKG